MTTPEVARWLADRLGCTVVAPDGPVLPTSDGGLFVSGVGWTRYRPGQEASWAGRRFPCPDWDSHVEMGAGPAAVVEPLPAGVWIRPHGPEEWLTPGRARLLRMVPYRPDVVTVVLGKEGTDELRLDEVERFWQALPESDRPKVRFVGYGPVALPPETTLGQALAELLDAEVCCYLGMPVGATDVFTVRADRSHGWKTFARQAIYRPGATPVVSAYQAPADEFPEIAPAVYRCAPDAVVEVVPAGLWVRPDQVDDAAAVRSRPIDPDRRLVLYEAGLRHLAEEVLGRFDYAGRLVSVLEAVGEIELYWLGRLLGSPDPVEEYLADKGGADLPTFRGACVVRVDLAGVYSEGQVIVEDGFRHMLTAPCVSQDGAVEVLVWSMTGRRTVSLEPDGVDGRVVFLPGTGFKVLSVSADRLLLRELSPTEFERDGVVADNRVALDKTIKATLLRTADRWAAAEPAVRIPADSAAQFQFAPGDAR
ncbi:hypothetical protein AB5J62_10790 [Amycolatopsis sp. cg5]|uniref:hypothetical protein n=1 Tax=Amycolatopsis sp. cg5 TaxID=3238802 RepID=UPI003526044A